MTQQERQQLDADFESVLRHYCSYAGSEAEGRLREAYEFAIEAHGDQRRKTGEPYVTHPLAVASILTELEVECNTLIAALLHDTVEDTGKTKEEVAERFGASVAQLVDGVTKLEKYSYTSHEELQAENYRKMFLAMAQDIRVVLIKLADRLHNMRTLKTMRPDKQARIARETIDIYAPLAHRLGIYKWKWELEDLCLRYLDRQAYYELVGAIAQRREEREEYLEQVILELSEGIRAMGIRAEIEGRPKHFYSIYRKMQRKHKLLDEIYDLFACRVIVDTVVDCYSVLGLVHSKFTPMPGRFKDYIGIPKSNNYQSLHTVVLGEGGIPFEVQIRTQEMHQVAEYGIAAHYRYKEGHANAPIKKGSMDDRLVWLRQLLEWQKDMTDASEYVEGLKNGLIEDEVFVFTPKGDVFSLPAGGTPIDFAYSIHSGLGNRMYGARINGKIAPLNTALKNGDIVEILTSEKIQGPSRDWLKIVRSSSARSKINQWFRKARKEEDIQQGKLIFERELKKLNLPIAQLMQPEYVQIMLDKTHFQTLNDLYAAIGYGGFHATKAIPKLRDEYIRGLSPEERLTTGYRVNAHGQVVVDHGTPAWVEEAQPHAEAQIGQPAQTAPKPSKRRSKALDSNIEVKGMKNCLVSLAQCCHPLIGDPIIGYISRGKGVTIHRTDCPNIRKLLSNAQLNPQEAERATRLIECNWTQDEPGESYTVCIRILARDRAHLLRDVSNAIAEEKIPIVGGSMNSVKDVTATFTLNLEIRNVEQYDRIMGRIRAVRDVIEVHRI